METKTKIILGIGAVAVLGTSVFLIARHLKKKKPADILPEKTDSNAFDEETPSPYAPQPTPQPTTPAPTTTTKASSTTTSSNTGSGSNNVKTSDGTTRSIGYSFDKKAKTISVSAMGCSGKYYIPNVKQTQQYIMDTLPEAKAEMSKHGGADGKLGNYTAKWFATLLCIKSQSIITKPLLQVKLIQLGIKKA